MIADVLPFLVALVASAFMAWAIGAGSSGATPFAPAVGANAVSVMRAAFVVGLLGFAGAALQGASVSTAIGSDLILGVTLPTSAVIVALGTAAGLMAVGIVTGYPIATAFTVTGVVVGSGLALGGDPAWGKYAEIGGMWLATPFVGGGIAYAIASVLPREDVPERASVPALAAVVAVITVNVEFALLAAPGEMAPVSVAVATRLPIAPLAGRALVTLAAAGIAVGLVHRDVARNGTDGLQRFLLVLGGLVAFSAGASQVGLAVGPLVPLVGEAVSVTALAAGGGVGLLIGSWTGAPRMIKAVAQDYASMGPRRSIAALTPSFAIAQVAVLLGVPVSFNQIVVSAIVGAGAAVGGTDVIGRRKVAVTVTAWVGSFLLAFALGFGVTTLVP